MFAQTNRTIGFLLVFAFLLQVQVWSSEVELLYDDFEDRDVSDWLGPCENCCSGSWGAATGDLVVQNTGGQNFLFRWGREVTGDATFDTQVTWNGQPQGFGFIGINVYGGQGSCGATAAYRASLKADGTLQIRFWPSGGPTYEDLAEASMPRPFDTTRDYRLQFEVRGDELELRVWPYDDEDNTVTANCTDERLRTGTFALQFNDGQGFSQGVFRFVRISQNRPGSFARGDTNADNNLDIADAVCVLSYLFGPDGNPCKEQVPSCLDAADTNDDGAVDIADAIAVLSHLFGGGGDLPEPFGECGIDPLEDELGCSSYEPCEGL